MSRLLVGKSGRVNFIASDQILISWWLMASLFEALNLYPESRFWRVRGSPDVSNVAGGVATLLVVVLMSAFTVSLLLTVFNRTNMNVNSLSQTVQQNETIAAQPANQSTRPFMVAIQLQNYMFYVSNQGELQPCNLSHFQGMLQADFTRNNLQNFVCLPAGLNHTFYVDQNDHTDFQIGVGSPLNITFGCYSTQNCQAQNIGVAYWYSRLSTNDKGASWVQVFESLQVGFYPKTSGFSRRFLQRIQLKEFTDIFTGSGFTASEGFELERAESTQLLDNWNYYSGQYNPSIYEMLIFLDDNSQVVELHYFTLLQALSQVGGLFNIIFAFFFVFGWYSYSLSEQVIAHQYLGSKAAGSYQFFGYIKLKLYQLLTNLKIKQQSVDTKIRDKLSITVTHLMDVVYLQQRIEYLEKAISVLLEDHHLKGIYLTNIKKRKEIDRNYKQHQLRRKVKYILRKKENLTAVKDKKGDSSERKMKEELSSDKNSMKEELYLKDSSDSDEYQQDLDDFDFQKDGEEEQLVSLQTEKQFKRHLERLVEESREGDQRSRRILERIDQQILDNMKREWSLGPLSEDNSKNESLVHVEMQPMSTEKEQKKI